MSDPTPAKQAVALAGQGRREEAVALLDRAAEAGNGEALFARGLWQVDGRLLGRDLAKARADFVRAAAAGYRDAGRVHAGFLAAGIGGERDWPGALEILRDWAERDPIAAQQGRLIGAMTLD
ncbi:MAG: hypothetical protein ACT4OE_06585 [Sphingosinicella sp.]